MCVALEMWTTESDVDNTFHHAIWELEPGMCVSIVKHDSLYEASWKKMMQNYQNGHSLSPICDGILLVQTA